METKTKNILLTLAGILIVAFTTALVIFLFHYFKFYGSSYNVYLKVVFSHNLYILFANIIAFSNIILFYILLRFKQYHLARGIIFSVLAMIITFVLIRYL